MSDAHLEENVIQSEQKPGAFCKQAKEFEYRKVVLKLLVMI